MAAKSYSIAKNFNISDRARKNNLARFAPDHTFAPFKCSERTSDEQSRVS
ncbi:hypothetical protein B194_3088 [Serratia plymuthica A30]|nr:hypothetical protein B194_3088 [Serratia plymuthica A30]